MNRAHIAEFEVRSSPHFKQGVSTDTIMLHVVLSLLPICLFAVIAFGWSALLMIAVSTASCVGTEHVLTKLQGKASPIGDYSATITGILLALCLPPGFPLWMTAVGGFVSIALGKALFGGLGANPFNPALVGRAFLQATFPVAITTWTPPFMDGRFTTLIPSTLAIPLLKAAPIDAFVKAGGVDGISAATPLAVMKFDNISTSLWNLAIGLRAGSAGETSVLLIVLCGAYLVARNMMNWRIPVGVLGSVAVFSTVFHMINPDRFPGPGFMILAGGIVLGAVFMASDMVASPMSPLGVWVYAALIGLLTVLIRCLGGLPEGTMYAILLGNAISPLIDRVIQPRIYGARRKPVRS